MRTTSWRYGAVAGAALLAGLAASAPARAGLFDDDEARRAILDIRSKITQNDEQQKAALAAAVKQLGDQLQLLQRSLLDVNNQNEQLRSDLARMRGDNEQLQRDVAELQRKQKDIIQGVDERVRKLEPQTVSLDGREFQADPEEKRAYDEAIALLRAGDFDKSTGALASFLKRYPGSGYNESARYWLGNAQYGKRDYKEAIISFRAFVAASPESPRAPEAMLAMANCQLELKDSRGAKKTLEDLLKAYPKSEAAQAAKERLLAMK